MAYHFTVNSLHIKAGVCFKTNDESVMSTFVNRHQSQSYITIRYYVLCCYTVAGLAEVQVHLL